MKTPSPIDLLKQEHHLISRMNADIERKISRFREMGHIDSRYVDTATDFIRTYADLCHHGKEEGILFRDLDKKDLEPAHQALMNELVREHEWARATTQKLIEANQAYVAGDSDMLEKELRLLGQICRFYPGHITKEESRFFNHCMGYFSEEEIQSMVRAFAEFDRGLVHDRYRRLVEALDTESGA